MHRTTTRPFRFLALSAALSLPAALAGCLDSSPPSVSGSSTEVTVHGSVKYKGQPVTKGQVRFDPANINRKDAKSVEAPIGADGTYTIKTLAGDNRVSVVAPDIAKKDFKVGAFTKTYDAPSGDSTFDIDLSN